MTNPVQQNPGQSFAGNFGTSQPSGILSTAPAIGTANTHTNTTVDTFGGGITTLTAYKGALIELGAGGHAPDILAAAAAAASSATILTATSTTATGTALRVYNCPGLITGEASAVTNGNTLLSSYYVGNSGTGGVLDQNDFNNALYGDVVFIAGGAFTPTAGGYIAGWFLESEDQGYNFEKTVSNVALPRAPDFIIPLFASAYAAGDRAWAKGVLFPSTPSKVVIQNQAGVTLSSTWGIWALPEGAQLTT